MAIEIGGKTEAIVNKIVGVVVILGVLAGLVGTVFIFLNNFVDNFTFDFGTSPSDNVAEVILTVGVILILVTGAFFLLRMATSAFRGR